MRKHRLAERLLVDVIGLEWEYVHDEACRWEHVMSERVERKILAMLKDHHESPYGNPIPGLDELGDAEVADDFRTGLTRSPSSAGHRADDRARPPHRRAGAGRPRGARPAHVAPASCPAPGSASCATGAASSRSARVPTGPPGSRLPDDVARHVFAAIETRWRESRSGGLVVIAVGQLRDFAGLRDADVTNRADLGYVGSRLARPRTRECPEVGLA